MWWKFAPTTPKSHIHCLHPFATASWPCVRVPIDVPVDVLVDVLVSLRLCVLVEWVIWVTGWMAMMQTGGPKTALHEIYSIVKQQRLGWVGLCHRLWYFFH